MLIVLLAMAGSAVGSFLNVCIDRLPEGLSIVSPPSHCSSCRRRVEPRYLVPIFSYFWLKGRCRYCSARIPARLPIVEIGTGALFVLLFWHYGLTWQLPVTIVWTCAFVVITFIDLEHHIIPNRIVYPCAVIGIALAPVVGPGILMSLLGGAIGFTLLLIPALLRREGMGFGDIKLAGLVGILTGYPQVFVALFLGIVSGGAVAAALLLAKKKGRKEGIPLGPFLALGAMMTLLWGKDILQWYLTLMQ